MTSIVSGSRSPGDTIENAIITYPPLARFPEVEDAGGSAIHAGAPRRHVGGVRRRSGDSGRGPANVLT